MTKYGLTLLTSILVFIVNLGVGQDNAEYQYPFQDPTRSVEERVSDILSLMTLDEKIAALSTNPSVLDWESRTTQTSRDSDSFDANFVQWIGNSFRVVAFLMVWSFSLSGEKWWL